MLKDTFSLFIENRKALFGLMILSFLRVTILRTLILMNQDEQGRCPEVVEGWVEPQLLKGQIDGHRTKSLHSVDRDYSERVTTKLPLNARPSRQHLLGTTKAGQDLFSQMVYGTRITLVVGLVTGLFTTILALTLALLAGYFGGVVDDIISLFTNVFLVIPSLPLMIVIAAYITVRGVIPIVLILGLTSWPWSTNTAFSGCSLRAEFRRVSRILGERPLYILFREILPNMISLVMASFFTSTMAAIREATLSLGWAISIVSWGTILFEQRSSSVGCMVVVPSSDLHVIGTSFALELCHRRDLKSQA